LRDVVLGMRHVHGRVFEENEPDIGQSAGLHLGVKALLRCRLGLVHNEVPAGHIVPVIEPITGMDIFR
jgi:hypothetical protein